MGSGGPVLAAVKAPRVARPLRAAALTPAPRGTARPLSPALLQTRPDDQGDAIPLAIEDSMGSSLGVSPTREDRWDRGASVPGFWAWTGIEWNGSSGRLRGRRRASGSGLSPAGGAAMPARGVAAAPGRSGYQGTVLGRPAVGGAPGHAGLSAAPGAVSDLRHSHRAGGASPRATRASRAGCAS
jgi:hypothetical protein